VLAAYVGIPGKGNASPNTPHIWAASEWNGYVAEQPNLRLLPMYTHNYADGDPQADGLNAVEAVKSLGWAPDMPGAERRIIVVDCEILVDPAYFSAVEATINGNGFKAVLYGSANTVLKNPCDGGYVVADWTNHPPTVLPDTWVGVQWASTASWDFDVYSHALYQGCGVGLRHG
jgi:hypothetical protein